VSDLDGSSHPYFVTRPARSGERGAGTVHLSRLVRSDLCTPTAWSARRDGRIAKSRYVPLGEGLET